MHPAQTKIVRLVQCQKLPLPWLVFVDCGEDEGHVFPKYIRLGKGYWPKRKYATALLAALSFNPALFIRLAKLYRPRNRAFIDVFVRPQDFSDRRIAHFFTIAAYKNVLEEVVCLLAQLCKGSEMAVSRIAQQCTSILTKPTLQTFVARLNKKREYPVCDVIASIIRDRAHLVVPGLKLSTRVWRVVCSRRAISQPFNKRIPAFVARNLLKQSIHQYLQQAHNTARILAIPPRCLFHERCRSPLPKHGQRRRSQSLSQPSKRAENKRTQSLSRPSKAAPRWKPAPKVVFRYENREWFINCTGLVQFDRHRDRAWLCRIASSDEAVTVYPWRRAQHYLHSDSLLDVTQQIGQRFCTYPRTPLESFLHNSYLCLDDLQVLRDHIKTFQDKQWKRFLCFIHADRSHRFDPFGLELLEKVLANNRDAERRILRYTRWSEQNGPNAAWKPHLARFPKVCAVLLMACQATRLRNWVTAYAWGHEACVGEMVALLKRQDLFLKPEAFILGSTLVKNIPVEIKRLLWYSANMSAQPDPFMFWPNSTENKESVFHSDIPTTVDFIQETHCAEVSYDRYSRAYCVFRNSHQHIPAENWLVSFANEEGQGSSVFLEVVRCLWQDSLESGFFSDTPTGLIIAPCEKDLVLRPMYFLGFISALCVARGLFLPFLVSDDMLRYLQLFQLGSGHNKDQSWQVGGTPCTDVFSAYKRNKQASIGSQESDADIAACSLPNEKCMNAFAGAWLQYCRLPLAFSRAELVFLVCGPQSARTPTALELAQAFDQSQWSDREQRVFATYLTALEPDDVARLLEFVTCKKRLPLLALGEHPLCVKPIEDEDAKLACAQNCVNTLLVPRWAAQNLEGLKVAIGPALRFPTSFGFE
jgi:hypothetical protein